MKWTFIIGFKGSDKEEEIESDYLPTFKLRNGDLFLYIVGKECGMYYWATEAYIKCVYEMV